LALLLSKDADNDGPLPFNKLYALKLNAILVTPSTCEAAPGKIGNGDGAVDFTRGFLYAGTLSIVSSLWKVDGDATSNPDAGVLQKTEIHQQTRCLKSRATKNS
jgi:CHAT domain-containing protein